MTILYIILAVIAIVLIIVFISANFAPDEFAVYSETVINQPLGTVFNYIKILKNQENYNKWVMADPNLKREYKGTDGQVGCTVYWDSSMGSVGKGEQEITGVDDEKRVDWIIRFEKPFKNVAGAYMETSAISTNSTKVRWTFTGQLTYMMKVMHIILSLKKVLTKDLTTSIGYLKTELEK